MRKGMMHMIEVIIAITMILSFLIVMRSRIDTTEDTGMEQAMAFQALQSLDKQGILRSYAIEEDFNGLNTQLDGIIPVDLSHTIRFCYLGENCTGGTLPDKNIFTAAYVVAGNATNFKPVEILLHIWR